ncbi:uncharacterized protein N7498_007040 [Penicillium cinerascens]|uniref:Uncharacterized protein n=1 Tax=Penicillium cinerascens TaxID=70096 RepID=A0A9W9JJ64_9EURO|nr:uncharacterized protein N7498_007040 [Penicillium cinerascens]KAJ5197923.1 hypothetical protein N7498_007040 [Penicillium cinerascens]
MAPGLPWPRFSKPKRRSPTRDEHPRDQPPVTEPGNEYERKPRYKTRKDRYEYKTTGSSNKKPSNADKHKTKRQRRSRKQTMNDGFHASNVARNRLTLGIFNRGRASYPVKLGDVYNFPLSETNLLSPKGARNTLEPIAALNQPSKQKEASCVQELFNCQNNDIPEQRDVGATDAGPRGPMRYLGGRKWVDVTSPHYGLSSSKISGLDALKELSIDGDAKRGPDHQIAVAVHGSQSATPFTWSESDWAMASLDPVMEDPLLNILQVGIFSTPQPGPDRCDDSKYYYTLQDLKKLMDARKATWQAKACDIQAAFRRASSLNLPPEPPAQTPDILKSGVSRGSISSLNITPGERKGSLALRKSPEQDVFCGWQYQRDCNDRAPDNLSPYEIPHVAHPDMSDDVFFRAVHAEFCAIMKPSSGDLTPSRQSPEGHHAPQKVFVYQHADVCSLPPARQAISHYGPIDPLLYEDIGSGIPHSTSHPTHCHDAQAGLVKCSSSGQLLPMLPTSEVCTEQIPDYAREIRSRQPLFSSAGPPVQSHAALPPGFWRQNKLY